MSKLKVSKQKSKRKGFEVESVVSFGMAKRDLQCFLCRKKIVKGRAFVGSGIGGSGYALPAHSECWLRRS